MKSIKSLLIKIGKVTDQLVAETAFNTNNQPAPSGQGTPAERFFRRGVRPNLPNSFKRNLNTDDMIKIRNLKRMKLAKRRRKSADTFHKDDTV